MNMHVCIVNVSNMHVSTYLNTPLPKKVLSESGVSETINPISTEHYGMAQFSFGIF